MRPPNGDYTGTSPILDAEVLSDGRIILAGQFTSFDGVPARGLVRLKPNGAIDHTFATGGGAQWTQTTETPTFFPKVDNIELEGDGKLLVTGTFEAFDGIVAPGIAT